MHRAHSDQDSCNVDSLVTLLGQIYSAQVNRINECVVMFARHDANEREFGFDDAFARADTDKATPTICVTKKVYCFKSVFARHVGELLSDLPDCIVPP